MPKDKEFSNGKKVFTSATSSGVMDGISRREVRGLPAAQEAQDQGYSLFE